MHVSLISDTCMPPILVHQLINYLLTMSRNQSLSSNIMDRFLCQALTLDAVLMVYLLNKSDGLCFYHTWIEDAMFGMDFYLSWVEKVQWVGLLFVLWILSSDKDKSRCHEQYLVNLRATEWENAQSLGMQKCHYEINLRSLPGILFLCDRIT